MKRNSLILLVLLGSAVVMSSCNKDDNQVTYQVGNQTFVTNASSSGNFEIQAAKLAQTKGVSDSVKIFADSMINDNTRMLASLNTVASQNGLSTTTTLRTSDQNNLNALMALSGVAFDKQYGAIMYTAHQATLSIFSTAAASNGVSSAGLRSFAGGQIPELQTQVNMSLKLQQYTQAESSQ